jgi:prolyl-tRNA synthetase
VVIVPIYKSEEQLKQISDYVSKIKKSLEAKNISVKFDNRDTHKPGFKFAEHELKGVPVRIAVGPRDMENQTVEVARRDTKEKSIYHATDIDVKVEHLLSQIQDNIYKKALDFRENNTYKADTFDEFKEIIENKGGFVYAHWDGTHETEKKIKELTKATIRCIPLNAQPETGQCILSGKPSSRRVLFAQAY